MANDQITTKPFVSQAQAGFAFATGQPWARRWARETGPYKKLPKRVKRKAVSLRLKSSYTLDDLYAYATGAGTHYDDQVAEAIAARIPDLVALKAERLAPGVSRIRGDLCNVHGRWGSCRAAGYGGPASARVPAKALPKGPKARGGKGRASRGRAAARPKKTDQERAAEQEQRRQARAAERARQESENRQTVDTALGLPEDAVGALDDLRAGTAVDDDDGGLVKLGLAEQAADGSYRLTAAGRALDTARAAGDVGRARDIMSSARDRKASQDARAAAAAERKRQAAQRAARGGGGRRKKPAATQLPGSRGGTPGTSSRVPRGRGAAKLPKASTAPTPDTPARQAPAKPDRPKLPEYLATAARNLSLGYSVGPSQLAALMRNGLAKQRKDGRWQLTSAGLRAAIDAGAEPTQIVQPPDASPAPTPRRRPPPRKRPPVRTKAHTGPHTGVMVALYPDAAARRALSRADGVTEDAEQLHLTLCYLGKITEQPLATNKDRLVRAIAEWAAAHGKPLTGTVNGTGRFTTVEDDGTNAVYVAPDVPGLSELRQSLTEAIERAGFDYSAQHDFTPHITVAYVPQDAPTPPIQVDTPIAFDHITLAWGDEHHDTPLGVRTKGLRPGDEAQPGRGVDQRNRQGNAAAKDHRAGPDVPVEEAVFHTAIVPSFAVFKDAAGVDRWLARTTTAFEDRDDEVISAAALATDAARADADGRYGPLRWWHLGHPNALDLVAPWGPGVDLGWCDFNAMHGRTLIESGTFKSAEIARAVAACADALELSPGFFHAVGEPDQDGVFHSIRRFERSLVPRWAGRASNRYTGLVVEKAMDAKKLAALKELGVSDATMTALLADVERAEKSADTNGVRYKEVAVDLFRAFLTDDPPVDQVVTKDAAPLPGSSPAAAAPPPEPPAPADDPIAARFKALEDRIAAQAAEIAALKAPQDDDAAETPAVDDDLAAAAPAPEEAMDDAGGDEGGLTLSPDDLMAIGQVVGQALAGAMEPLIGALGITTKLDGHLGELKSMLSGYTKTKDDATAQQAQELANLKAQVAELDGTAPRVAGYRASEAMDTLAPALAAALKDGPPGGAQQDLGPFADQLAHWFPNLAQPGQQR